MNLKRSLPFALVAMLLAGCSSVPTNVDKSPIRAQTFSFLTPKYSKMNERRTETHKLIQSAIVSDLNQKGMRQVASGGDVEVGYMVIVANNASTFTYDEFFGYGGESAALTKKAHKAMARSKSRDLLEIGAIVIDVTDTSDSKLLFRSPAHTSVKDVTRANRADRINMLVASSLGSLRVKP